MRKPQYYDKVFGGLGAEQERFMGRVTRVHGNVCYFADPEARVYSTFIWRFGNTPNQRFRCEPGGDIPLGRHLTVLDPRSGQVFLQKRLPDGFEKVQSATLLDCFQPGPERDSLDPAVVSILNRAFSSGDWYITATEPQSASGPPPAGKPLDTPSGKKPFRTRSGMRVSGR